MRDVRDQVFRIIDNAENGNIGMLEAATDLKDIQSELDFLSGQIKDWMRVNIEELSMTASSYPDGFGGYRFEYRNGSKRWSFKNVPEWVTIENEKKALEHRLKLAWEGSQKNILPVNEDGEIMTLPEVKYSDPVLIFKKIKYE